MNVKTELRKQEKTFSYVKSESINSLSKQTSESEEVNNHPANTECWLGCTVPIEYSMTSWVKNESSDKAENTMSAGEQETKNGKVRIPVSSSKQDVAVKCEPMDDHSISYKPVTFSMEQVDLQQELNNEQECGREKGLCSKICPKYNNESEKGEGKDVSETTADNSCCADQDSLLRKYILRVGGNTDVAETTTIKVEVNESVPGDEYPSIENKLLVNSGEVDNVLVKVEPEDGIIQSPDQTPEPCSSACTDNIKVDLVEVPIEFIGPIKNELDVGSSKVQPSHRDGLALSTTEIKLRAVKEPEPPAKKTDLTSTEGKFTESVISLPSADGVKEFLCKYCNTKFDSLINLTTHLRSHKGEKPFVCDICQAKFRKSSHLVQHKRTHTGEKPYTCEMCNAKFSQLGSLVNHKKTHTGDKPYSCDMCDKRFKEYKNLKQHKLTHSAVKPLICDVCDATFTRASNLLRHKLIHTDEKPYACEICDARFKQSGTLKHHRRTHTGEKPFACDLCNVEYSRLDSLTLHKRTHSEDKPYICDVCNASFKLSSYLTKHKRIHSDEKPFGCDLCSAKFRQARYLARHLESHRRCNVIK